MSGFSENSIPDIKFQIESQEPVETLKWLVDFSYTISKHQALSAEESVICNAPILIGPDGLLDYLNTAYAGKTITPEQAQDTILSTLKKTYPCK